MDATRKVLPLEELSQILTNHHLRQQKIIFVHGVFDILHRGHVTLLAEAKQLSGILVVGVESDENVKILKGEDRPIHQQDARIFVLSYLEPVDYILLIPPYQGIQQLDQFYRDLYKKLQIDILATCVSAGRYGPYKKAHASAEGIDFVDIPTRYERNTTKIIELLCKK